MWGRYRGLDGEIWGAERECVWCWRGWMEWLSSLRRGADRIAYGGPIRWRVGIRVGWFGVGGFVLMNCSDVAERRGWSFGF